MDVLLLNPPVSQKSIYGELARGAPLLPPLGLCYLAASLEKASHRVRILDLCLEPSVSSALERAIRDGRPDLVGITATIVSLPAAGQLAKTVAQSLPAATTILGGPHLSALPKQTMSEMPDVDYGIVGEGERTLVELVDGLAQGNDPRSLPGLVLRNGQDLFLTAPREPIHDLDSLPRPARHLLPALSRYRHTVFRSRAQATTAITSRGCPYACSYCSQSVFGRKIRGVSAVYIMDEVRELREKFSIDFVSFEDDVFNYSRKRIVELCERMIREDLKIRWGCSVRVEKLDGPLLQLMKRAGLHSLYIGLETPNPRLQSLIKKPYDTQDALETMNLISRLNIRINASFILGFPTETPEEIRQTVRFSKKVPANGVTFFRYTPFPDTALRSLALENGWVSNRWEDYTPHIDSVAYVDRNLNRDHLSRELRNAYRRFFFRPSYLWRVIRFGDLGLLIKGLLLFLAQAADRWKQ